MAVELSFAETGSGPSLVILHGLFGSKRNWASIARLLGRHHRVLTLDLRNHGDSPWDARHDYPAIAEDVAEVIRTVAGGTATVIGHSMGGKAAMLLALEYPALVERLVVVDIAPATSRGTSIDVLHAMRAVPLATCTRRTDVVTALESRILDPGIRAFLAQSVTVGPDGLAWSVNLDAIERHFDAIRGFPDIPSGRTYDGPVLFITGGRSVYVEPEHWPVITRLFPRARRDVFEEAGHWVHADAPARFVEAVDRFLEV